ncbi:MAG TPA: UbiA family prenyltransferase, partial [Acidobacteriota bacterium]|nr:UbiA family prenyltransferase [Acidobacteriota bacterium]
MKKMKLYMQLARPFTLMPPLLGIISGAICAIGSVHNPYPGGHVTVSLVLTIILGSLCAAFLNAANNSINQIYDLEIDRLNKPNRPLVTRELTMREGWIFTWICYA